MITGGTITRSFTFNGASVSFALGAGFQFVDEGDLVVVFLDEDDVETPATLGDDYSVSGNGRVGTGRVNVALDSQNDYAGMRVDRVTSIIQDVEFLPGSGAPAAAQEKQLDRFALAIQEDRAGLARSLKVVSGETIGDLPAAADRAGAYLAFDAEGDPVAASGTGADEALRTDLAASSGAALVGALAAGVGAVARSAAGIFLDRVSILDFVPVAEHAAIRARTSTTDLADYFTAAIAALDATGGGELYIPAGRYQCGSTVALCNNLRLRGAGKASAHVQFTHAGTNVPDGSGFKLIQPSNTSSSAYVHVSDINVEMTHASNVGACFYDNCSSYLTLRDCIFQGGKFGVVFDQTEVSGIYSCAPSGQLAGGAGLWLVNGPDITFGNLGGFTNQITLDHNCQFNQSGTAYAIIDDGGDSHYIGSVNCNGGGFKFCGVGNLTILGGEYESVSARPTMTFGFQTHYSGGGAGACSHVKIENAIIIAPGGNQCISIVSASGMKFEQLLLTASAPATACITGAANSGTIISRDCGNPNTALPVFDGYANTFHDDGYVVIRTTAATSYTLGAPEFFNALVRTTSGSAVAITVPAYATYPFPVGTTIRIEQGGAGAITVAGAGGVTVDGTATTAAQYQTLTLTKTATDRWLAIRGS